MERQHAHAVENASKDTVRGESQRLEEMLSDLKYGQVKPRGWRRISVATEMQPMLLGSMAMAKVEEAERADTSHVLTTVTDQQLMAQVPGRSKIPRQSEPWTCAVRPQFH